MIHKTKTYQQHQLVNINFLLFYTYVFSIIYNEWIGSLIIIQWSGERISGVGELSMPKIYNRKDEPCEVNCLFLLLIHLIVFHLFFVCFGLFSLFLNFSPTRGKVFGQSGQLGRLNQASFKSESGFPYPI